MDRKKLIETIKEMVHEKCKDEANAFGYEIWEYHMIPVVKYATLLAEKLNADKEIVEIAALLHDYASVKDIKLYKEHHIHGANEAEEILTRFSYPHEKIEKVKNVLLNIAGVF